MIRCALLSLLVYPTLTSFTNAEVRVNYRGEFSYVLSRFCEGPPPSIVAQCAEELELVSVSDNSFIECTAIDDIAKDDGFESSIRCITTCDLESGADGCSTVYRENQKEIVDNIFASIDFNCIGKTSVDARFIWEKPTRDGSCGSGLINSYNLHMIRMGVYSELLQDYDYSGNYFESEPITVGGNPNAFGPHEDHVIRHPILKYTAIDGSTTCFKCSVTFEELVLDVDENRLLPEHIIIENENDDNDYEIPPAPEPAISPPGTYTVQYEGNWMVSWISTYSCDIVDDAIPTATFSCTNGGSIRLVETLFDTVSCESTNGGKSLRCQDSDDDNYYQFLRIFEFTGIIFECTGLDELPGATVVMDPITVNCLYQGVERVRLGLVCDTYRTYHDIYFECGPESLFFTPFFTVDTGSDDEDMYVCYTAANFPNGREDGDITTDAACMETDWRLSWNIPRECYAGPDLIRK